VQALPQATFLLLLEAAVGGTIALFWVHLREEVNRGFTLFTGICFLVAGGLAIWLRTAFSPLVSPDLDPRVISFANRLIWTQPLLYVLAIAISFVSLDLTLAIYLLVPLLYVIPSPFLRWPHGASEVSAARQQHH